MAKMTAAMVKKLKPSIKRRFIRDDSTQSLYLVIQPSGVKTWQMRFRGPDGRPVKMVLGRLHAGGETPGTPTIGEPLTLHGARQLAAQVHREREQGLDPAAQHKARKHRARAEIKERKADTFGSAICEFFIEYRTKKWKQRLRRWRDDAAVLGLRYPVDCDPGTIEPEVIKGRLAHIWASKPIAEIDDHDVHTVVSEARRGKGGSDGKARKLYAALSVFFGWLQDQRRIRNNPCVGVSRPGAPAARERVLKPAEIVSFWSACDKLGGPFGPLYKILLLTGCRLREVSDMRRTELSADYCTIPGSRTKNHRPHALPVPTMARQIINSVPVIEGEGYVFTTTGKTPVSGFSKSKQLLDEVMVEYAGGPVEPWRTHDLRRTAASGMQKLGIRTEVIERALNHVSGSFAGVAGIYQCDPLEPEVREALQRWADHIAGLVEGRPDNVVPLPRKAQ